MTQTLSALAAGQRGPHPLISARGIGHSYGRMPVLTGVDLQARRGELLGLIGPNGGGKTTLLRTLFGALSPQEGTVMFDGRPLEQLSPRQIARRIAVVVQEPQSELLLSVVDMALLGRTPHLGVFSRRSPRDDALAAAALDKVGALGLAHRDVSELSGGEKQRVLIARALVQEADCLLLDEPTNHLDIGYQHQVLDLVRSLGMTAVVVLHDLNLAARYCDRLVLLDRGRVRATGEARQVLRPELIGSVYGVGAERATAYDEVPQLLFRRPEEAGDDA